MGSIDLYEDLRKICAKGGINLTIWISAVCWQLYQWKKANEVKDLDLGHWKNWS